jgi:dihydrofolate synthase/folylpolyglutamate synthase
MRMAGSFQARNGQLAVAAVRALRERGFEINEECIRAGLQRARIPGRAEIIDDTVPVVLDGAHNPEKLAAFAADVPALLPGTTGRRIVVSGLLDSKAGSDMIPSLLPITDVLIATSPQVLAKDAKVASAIEGYARQAGYTGDVLLCPDPEEAVDAALRLATPGEDAVIVTGSLYLVGNVRGRWYPEEAVLAGQSPWPTRREIIRR